MQKITLLCTLVLAVVFGCACGRAQSAKPTAAPTVTQAPVEKPTPTPIGQVTEGKELVASVETEEEAKAIAEQYGMELVEFSYGVATFHTEEDPKDVIARGEENGWPTLSLNREVNAY